MRQGKSEGDKLPDVDPEGAQERTAFDLIEQASHQKQMANDLLQFDYDYVATSVTDSDALK